MRGDNIRTIDTITKYMLQCPCWVGVSIFRVLYVKRYIDDLELRSSLVNESKGERYEVREAGSFSARL